MSPQELKPLNNKAIYTHCASHKLNLAIVKALKYPTDRNMIDTADKIVRFYNNSPKREVNLQSGIEEMKRDNEDEHNSQKRCVKPDGYNDTMFSQFLHELKTSSTQ